MIMRRVAVPIGFRRMRMAAAGIPRDHIAKVLNHVEGGARATRVYDRHTYDREKRLALETWARTLQGIIDNTDGSKVLPFSATGAQLRLEE